MSEARIIENEETAEVREHFDVDNDMKAEWVISKIRKIRQNQKREKEELERQMRFYQDQAEIIDREADENVAFFESMLREYFQSRVDEGFAKATKTKVTYKLPTGELILKHREPEYEYKQNQQQTIDWLKNSNAEQYIKVKEELKWTDLKKDVTISGNNVAYKATGEIIPGITVTEREDEFQVEVK